ncbi:MAG: hypothetical protein GY797_38760 [Deltaproteobacteria bacterium]|nr:hypothetical protein [Deltaproteobacteria bacterium]
MSDFKGYKAGEMVVIVGSGSSSCDMKKLAEMAKFAQEKMHMDMEIAETAFISFGEAGVSAAVAMKGLPEAMLACPDEMIKVVEEMDFSKCEKMVLDSLTTIDPTAYGMPSSYEESKSYSKKEWKKIQKKMKKHSSIHEPKSQKEIWANSWDKKIKRKL